MKGKVLYIEDEQQLLDLVLEVIERAGYEGIGATDGLSGIKVATESIPDLILLDLNLPTMSGWEVLTKIKVEEALEHIPIVVITGETDEEEKERALVLGASGFLRKPLNIREIPGIIAEYLGGKQDVIDLTTEKREGYIKEYRRRVAHRLQEQVESLKQANQEMQALNRELARRDTYIQNMQDPLWVMDSEGKTVDFNPALEKFLGVSAEKLSESSVYDFLDETNRLIVDNIDATDRMAGKSTVYQLSFTASGGKKKPALVSGHPIIEDGEYIGTFAVIKDISDRKLLEEKYRNIFINAREGLYQSTIDGKLFIANPTLVEMLGYETENELLGVNIVKDVYVNPKDRERLLEMLAKEKNPDTFETQFYRKDGKKIYVVISARLIESDAPEGAYIERNIIDITERKKLEREKEVFTQALEVTNRELQEANRLKDEFLASMSHELRTPLNSIIGFSEVLVDGLSGELNEEQQEFIQNIHASGLHLLELINGILDISKIRAGMMTLSPESVDLAALGIEVASTFLPHANKKRIKWDVVIPERELIAPVDHLRIKQILLNIVGNAFKFTPEMGVIHFSLKKVSIPDWNADTFKVSPDTPFNAALYEVEDSGIGIAKENMEMIFDEFRQVDGSFTRDFGGSGLGLPIAKKLIELHEGRIWVESQIGRGSTFRVALPLNSRE